MKAFVPARTGRAGAAALLAAALAAGQAAAYPIDAYEHTGIGRLEVQTRVEDGRMDGPRQPKGALLTSEQVRLRLTGQPDAKLPAADPEFTRKVVALLSEYADRYSLSVLDMTDPAALRYAEHDGDNARNPGSVGKILVALALYQKLADLYPDDMEARWRVLKDTRIVADEYIISDHHTVRMWNRETEELIRRPLEVGDEGSLMEFIDWMMSPSSNAAAATLMKQAVLMERFGHDYPVDTATANAYLTETPKGELRETLAAVMHPPVTRNGLNIERLRQGSLFTRTGKARIPGTTSYATTRELMNLIVKMEQGRLVDAFSSLEIKRMLYVTERRIRYASSPVLHEAAVYFKSGSLYQCEPEPDFTCRKYHGNVKNYMNSLAIVEAPAENPRVAYAVTLMSNVLRRNSAVDHQTLATRIHELILEHHATQAPAPEPQPVVPAVGESMPGG